ncbi:MAG TPA: hypothetical protein EYM86_03775 [Flavobacteriales bacterium]|jgi:hypothetical protein|nr:hypothetical protein [Flavobacteriales bacterium]HIN41552.1 hypothetical protein [Flavobacteriales bacterium]
MGAGVQKAVLYTLAIHAVALFVLTQVTVSDVAPASEQYADVDFYDVAELEELLEREESKSTTFEDRLEERISNLRSDASKESSSEKRSSGITEADLAAMEAEIAAELAALEASELERLSAEEKSFETVGVPELDSSTTTPSSVDTMDDWDKQYEGRVTVRFDLQDRVPQHLDVPGYQCRGRADIEVSIIVDPSGKVLSAEVISGASPSSCFAQAAIKSALASKFLKSETSPRRQDGTLNYAFVAQ